MVGKYANEDIAAQFRLDEAGLSPLVKIDSRNFFICLGLKGGTQCRRLGSSVCRFSLICSMLERPL